MAKVLIFLQDADSKRVLLVRKYAEPLHGKWYGITGETAQGEDLAECAQRTVMAESGLILPRETFRHVTTFDGSEVMHAVATALTQTAKSRNPDEPFVSTPENTHWTREPLAPGLEWLLPLVLSGQSMTPTPPAPVA